MFLLQFAALPVLHNYRSLQEVQTKGMLNFPLPLSYEERGVHVYRLDFSRFRLCRLRLFYDF